MDFLFGLGFLEVGEEVDEAARGRFLGEVISSLEFTSIGSSKSLVAVRADVLVRLTEVFAGDVSGFRGFCLVDFGFD